MKKELGTFTGKTPEDALKFALENLKLTEKEVTFEVLEKGKPGGFLGIGAVKAKIVVYSVEKEEKPEKTEKKKPVKKTEVKKQEKPVKKEKKVLTPIEGSEDGKRAVEFLKGLLSLLEIEAVPVLVKEDEKIEIELDSEKTHDLIGKHGVMLDAIQNLAGAVANIGRNEYKRVVVDCDGYREKRDETLVHVANKKAEKAIALGRKVALEPMSAYERRIIHATLAENDQVKTFSEGKEPRRFVVIVPNELKPYEKKDKKYGHKGGKPYGNKDGYKDRKPRRNYTEEEKAARSQVGGGTVVGATEKGNSYKKSSSVVFGTFLGNSLKDEKKDEE